MTYKLNFADVKAKAHGQWINILEFMGLSVASKSTHVECPVCSGVNCFRVDDVSPDKTYVCKCGAGDGFKLMREALNISAYEAFKRVNEYLSGNSVDNFAVTVKPRSESVVVDLAKKQRAVDNALKYASRLPSVEALDYYDARGITCSMRKHDFVSYSKQNYLGSSDYIHPVIMPRISKYKGNTVGLVRIYLDLSKLNVDHNVSSIVRKTMMKGGVETLSGCGTWFTSGNIRELHVCEGYENALSVAVALKTTRVVCGHTASLMGNLIIPDCVETMHVWADNGEAGERAVERLQARYDALKDVIVHYPPRGMDWNDVLIEDGGKMIRQYCNLVY